MGEVELLAFAEGAATFSRNSWRWRGREQKYFSKPKLRKKKEVKKHPFTLYINQGPVVQTVDNSYSPG